MWKAASQDNVALVFTVRDKFGELESLYAKSTGDRLTVPLELMADCQIWKVLLDRFLRGDYRIKEGELGAVRRFAQWTVDVKRFLCGQEPKKVVWS